MAASLAAIHVGKRRADDIRQAGPRQCPPCLRLALAIAPDRALRKIVTQRNDLCGAHDQAKSDPCRPREYAPPTIAPRPERRHGPPGRKQPGGQKDMRTGLNVPTHDHQPDHDREHPRPPGPGLVQNSIASQQQPGQPDGDRSHRIEQPDNQEPAEGIDQSRKPTPPVPAPPRPREQKHSQPGDPEPPRGHPCQGARHRAQIGDQVERVEHRALAAGKMGRSAPRVRVPERQTSLPDHRPVELQPRLELKYGIHQQTIDRFVIASGATSKACLHQQDIGRAQNAAAQQRLVKIDSQATRQHQGKAKRFSERSHGAWPPCPAAEQKSFSSRTL